jgi:Mg-chelatase subunit ChlD
VPCQPDSTSGGATPLLRSLQAMLARRARRQRPDHLTS